MSDRLSTLDSSFLALEEPTTPMHVGSVMVFDAPEGGFDWADRFDPATRAMGSLSMTGYLYSSLRVSPARCTFGVC